MRICMAGAMGRMGRRILELADLDPELEIGGAFDAPQYTGQTVALSGRANQPVVLAANADEALGSADLLIDFTHADACLPNVRAAARVRKPCVVGTTGLSRRQQDELRKLASGIAIVFAPNMSVGVNLLFKLTSEVAATLGLDYNVEIIETHHSLKKDSPSGTAVRLAERAAQALGLKYPECLAHGREGMVGERPRNEIGLHAVRGGDVVGEHTVCFIGNGERIELTHKAHSRDNFARGALRAAKFVASASPGLYDMEDVLGFR